MFCTGFDVEFKNCAESFEGFLGEICITVDLNDVSKERRGNGVITGFETEEEGVHMREVAGPTKFDDKGVVGSIGMTKIGLFRS